MKNFISLFMCPECGHSLSDTLECSGCGHIYTNKNGIYDVISQKISGTQEILWKITDEMIENDAIPDWISDEDYNSRKNKETLEAEKMSNDYINRLISNFSGTVCDLATGRGGMLQKLLDSANKDFNIVCTDISDRILMLTRKLKQTEDERVFYAASDGRHMSFNDGSFDYITSFAGFGNIPEGEKVAKELYRILKPGGKIVIQGNYIAVGSKSFELAKSRGLEKGLVEEFLINELENAGFKNIISTVATEAVWAENPYDLIPVTGDTQRYCIIQAERV